MNELHKYVRTPHIRGSRLQHGDHDLEDVKFSELIGKHLVIEEKMDGANCGISFTKEGELLLQSRGHYLRGGPREKHFALMKQWAASKQDVLFNILGSRYVMYGEWLYALHTVFYDALPHYFMEFDMLDLEDGAFLSTRARARAITGTSKRSMVPTAIDPIVPVAVIAEGEFKNLHQLEEMIQRSGFITDQRHIHLTDAALAARASPIETLSHTDMNEKMEGLYIKWEEDGIVKGRYKFVRDSFTSSILDQETHWHDRPIIQNKLVEGGMERMFE